MFTVKLSVLFAFSFGLALAPPRLNAQPCTSSNQPCVLTAQYDNNRDGYNPKETVLSPTNINLTQLAPLLVDTPPSGVFPACVYIPTTGISYSKPNSSQNAVCTASSPCSGLVVYCGPNTTACNGNWQQ